MTEATFHGLSWQEQVDTVWATGTLLMTRRVPDYGLHLYAIGAFFAEIWICQRHYEVRLVRAFSYGPDLDPYLTRLSLAELNPIA